MRSLLLTALAGAAAAIAGCSSDVTASGGGGSTGSGGAGGATVTTTSSTTSTSTSIGGGGAAGGSDHGSFDTAQSIDVGATLQEDLVPGASDYYVFTGTKGEALDIQALAQYLDSNNPAPYDPTYLDTVVSLYDAGRHKIAESNDLPYQGNDADLFTVLPADGTYYVRVTECWTWSAESGKKCAAPQQKTHTAYSLGVYKRSAAQANVVFDPVPDTGNTQASATPLKFAKGAGDKYYWRTDVYGFFSDATDVDWFSFAIPADAPVNQGRLTAYLIPEAAGTTFDGSTESIGAFTVYDSTGATVLAQANGAVGGGAGVQRIELPVAAGQTYLLSIARSDGIVGSNDFYVVFVTAGGSNEIEKDDAANDALAGAETLPAYSSASGYVSYFPGGDLVPAATDVDYWAAPVPANLPSTAKVSAACDGLYFGSGLRGLSATLVDAAGNAFASGTETANGAAYTTTVPVPAGAKTVYLKVHAASQDPVVTSTYYACGIYFFPN